MKNFLNYPIIVGVSGGPDSMFLLNFLKKKYFTKPIVVHINYQLRKEANLEETLVREYCKLNKLILFKKTITNKDWEKYAYLKNKQSQARAIRYDYFKEIAKQLKTKTIYIGHHKDDFIETAIMSETKNENLLFYGILKRNKLNDGFIIKRPLLNFFKNELIDYNKRKRIPFLFDKSNLEPIYQRNKVRIKLASYSIKEKKEVFDYYKKINKTNEIVLRKIAKKNKIWRKESFDLNFLLKQEKEVRYNLIYQFLISSPYWIKISKNKIENLLIFLKTKNKQTKYRLMSNIFVKIENNKIKIIKERST